jgi:hypothetical protein
MVRQYAGLGTPIEGQELEERNIIDTVEEKAMWWLAHEYNQSQKASKLVSRLHFSISDTLPGAFVDPPFVRLEPDIDTLPFTCTADDRAIKFRKER